VNASNVVVRDIASGVMGEDPSDWADYDKPGGTSNQSARTFLSATPKNPRSFAMSN
jgi:hypothetical protein